MPVANIEEMQYLIPRDHGTAGASIPNTPSAPFIARSATNTVEEPSMDGTNPDSEHGDEEDRVSTGDDGAPPIDNPSTDIRVRNAYFSSANGVLMTLLGQHGESTGG